VLLPRVAINIDGAQLRQPGFHDEIRNRLQSHSVDPGFIEFEFSERSLMDDPVGMQDSLYALKDMGVRLAIKCASAGPSGLSHLQQFPLDVLKIDRAFLADVATSKDAQVICSIVLTIAHRLSLVAVAEGVESDGQESFLARYDCLYGQGPYYSVPVDSDRVAAMMAERGGQAARQRRVIRRRKAMNVG
jgi:EAL domain-containing protein (putative c-di-GMP-specific phosphodiesterase class I)